MEVSSTETRVSSEVKNITRTPRLTDVFSPSPRKPVMLDLGRKPKRRGKRCEQCCQKKVEEDPREIGKNKANANKESITRTQWPSHRLEKRRLKNS